MDIEFDPIKDQQNIARHGMSLIAGLAVLLNQIGTVEDTRRPYGEVRLRAFAAIDGRYIACVYTMRGDTARIISVHHVREKDVRKWPG